jgi:hypothetical protein
MVKGLFAPLLVTVLFVVAFHEGTSCLPTRTREDGGGPRLRDPGLFSKAGASSGIIIEGAGSPSTTSVFDVWIAGYRNVRDDVRYTTAPAVTFFPRRFTLIRAIS